MATLTHQAASTSAGDLPAMPIEPSWIREGNPVARGAVVLQTDDKKVSSGLWSCEPGRFEWTFSWDEFVLVLEGEVDVTEDETNNTITLRPGDMAHFALGMKTHWHVKRALRKFFVIRTLERFES